MSSAERIGKAVAALGDAPLDAAGLREHVFPLFSRTLARQRGRIVLANHSLGRPLDALEDDVREALSTWYDRQGDAWDDWMAEQHAFRSRIGVLCGVAPVSIVFRTSAGAGLRAVLSSFPRTVSVVATRGEFDSLDVILREHAVRDRVKLTLVEPDARGWFDAGRIVDAIAPGTDLVVVSQVMFQTGQRLDVEPIIDAAHRRGARLLLDIYHSLGVFPLDLAALKVDFAVGGSYKYLRGGPGAAFLYVSPQEMAERRTLDIGWFAKEAAQDYARPDPPRYEPGADGWQESTPPVLAWYQARSGQLFTMAIGVPRLRAWSLALQRRLVDALAARGVEAWGGTEDRGAFVVVVHPAARDIAAALDARDVIADARGSWLRLCPDVLNDGVQLDAAAEAVSAAIRAIPAGAA